MDASVEHGRAHPHHDHHETYEHKKNIKKGSERLDRRSAAGVHGQPKKSGHGGKFTWGGPTSNMEYDGDDSVVALDEKDPNYDEEEQEEQSKKAVVDAVDSSKTPSASQT